MAIKFIADNHSYVSTDGAGINWLSATTFVSAFKQPFDAKGTAEKVVRKKASKWYGLKPDEVIALWDKESKRATDLGTFYHNERERDICASETISFGGFDELPVIKPLNGETGEKLAPEQKLDPGIYPEHFVYLKSAGLCGQSDMCIVTPDKKVHIVDYKTNKSIDMQSFKNWDGTSKKMKFPVSHLDDCNFNHYALQLSLYMFVVLKHNPLLNPGTLTLHHILFEESGRDQYDYPITRRLADGSPIVKDVVPYSLPYLKSEIIQMMQHYKAFPEEIRNAKK
jgi:hypothetical protein